jgi:hypothetical protein
MLKKPFDLNSNRPLQFHDFPKITAQGLYNQMNAKYMRAPARLDRAIFMRLALDVETILLREKMNDSLVYNRVPTRRDLRC